MTALYASGRCKLHGGMSTGAKTPEGKARQLEDSAAGWRESGRPPARVTIRSKVRADGTQYAERYAAKRRFFSAYLFKCVLRVAM